MPLRTLTDVVDLHALRAGALVAAAIAVPAGIIAQVFADDDGGTSGWISLFALAVLVGLAAGAAVAARLQRTGTALTHGILTAVGVFVVVQAAGLVRRSIAGDDITWSRIASSFLLSLMAGTVGGLVGSFLAGSSVRRQSR